MPINLIFPKVEPLEKFEVLLFRVMFTLSNNVCSHLDSVPTSELLTCTLVKAPFWRSIVLFTALNITAILPLVC